MSGFVDRITRVPSLPDLAEDAHKGDAGRLLCVCGSATMPGAAILTVRAACRAGAGLVSLGCLSANLLELVPVAAPEAILVDLTEWRSFFAEGRHASLAERRDHARVLGPGLGRGELTRTLVELFTDDGFEGPTVFDADALNELAAQPELVSRSRGPAILTPHPGEASRLLGREVPSDDEGRLAAARELAQRTHAITVLKGRRTVVVAPEGELVFVNQTGNAGMATGGSGDVLSGILGAYLTACRPGRVACANGASWTPFDATVAAVHVHGLAGDLAADELGRRALIASDLIEFLPAAQQALGEDAR